jgi:hypothetical protein
VRFLLLAVLVTGCAAVRPPVPVGLIFEDGSAPLEYRADVGSASLEVQGEACRNALGFPRFLYGGQDLVGWGEAGYRDAVRKARESAPAGLLADVRVDLRVISVLIFRRECLVVTAAVR